MQASGLSPKVLIIEDSTTVCLFMAQALEKVGYHVIIATDGREGFMKALQEGPQCLVLDVVLPGVSGFEVCRQLRARDPLWRIPIIMVSIKDTPVDRAWGLSQGADRYLPKPFTEETLVQTVGEVLLERSQPPWTQRIAAVKPPSPPSPPSQEPSLALNRLVPRRNEDADLMSSSNPLSGSAVISDKQARRLYTAIDGQKSVEELCAAMNLDLKEASRALQLLLAQHLINLRGEETLVQTVGEVLPERSELPSQGIAAVKPPSPPSPPSQEPSLALNRLVPRRNEDADLMSSSNPLSGSAVISDKQARRLYTAIDGQKSVEELCAAMNLDLKEASRALQLLLARHLIHLYEPGRRLADNSLFLDDH